jgi:hypothetical protein
MFSGKTAMFSKIILFELGRIIPFAKNHRGVYIKRQKSVYKRRNMKDGKKSGFEPPYKA